MADKYGPIFSLRLGSHPAVVVSSWEMIKDCFTTNDRIFASRPSMSITKYMFYKGAVFSLAPYGPYWRDIRKMVTLQLLTSHQLEKLSHVRVSELDQTIKDLYLLCEKNGDSPNIALNKWLEDLTFNMTIRMLVGKRFSNSNNGSEEWHFKEAIKKVVYLSGVFIVSDAIPSLEWMDIGGYLKAMKTTTKEVDKVLGSWLEERVQKRKECATIHDSDFMDVMLSTFQETDMVSGYNRDTVIKATILILIMAGSETTGETLIWAISSLLNNRRTLEMAQEELDIHVGRNKLVEESDIKKLNYLQAVVKETLRLYPPAPLSGPREAAEDCYVGNYYVPKGTRLIANLWKLHRDPKVWSNPNEFRPERFLEEHSNVNYRGQNFEYIPFSSGRRMCPAINSALQVIHLALARFLQGFYISTPMNILVDMGEGPGLALPKVKPLDVVLTPRLPKELYENL
ncbi:Cytochrome [Abeliophyllum distichum]|uniref:Flavonoid-6-hydroxylase n=1 Tax=Abeliophyllum distichum TaxID=126358 RepID=A0ABD1Q4C2_9LAMI